MRDQRDTQAKEEFLRSGSVPVGYALRSGLASMFRDPLLMAISNLPGPIGLKLRQWWYRARVASMGKGVVIDCNVCAPYLENLYLEDFCFLGWGTKIYAPEGSVKIGRRCHVTGQILGHGGVILEDYSAVGGRILSITDRHNGGARMTGPMVPHWQRNLKRAPVRICKDAFVAENTVVMPGVTIGAGAVVAPFSLVVRNVAAWTVVSGAPAIKVGEREPVKHPDP